MAWLPALIGILTIGGCGGSGPELGDVHGLVTLDGAPLPYATVVFAPDSNSRAAIGVTDADGKYSLGYSATATGSRVGAVHVRITTLNPSDTNPVPERVPARYNSKTELTAVVDPAGNEINFALEGDLLKKREKSKK